MKVYIEETGTTREITIENPQPLKELLKQLNISNESVILVKNNTIVLEDEIIENTDEIKLLTVISGG